MNKDKRYIAFLDILGFKDLIARNDLDTVAELYHRFQQALFYTMAQSNMSWRLDNLNNDDLPGIDKSPLNSLIISDSILLWTDDDSGKDFVQLLWTVKFYLDLAFSFGIPLRGAITFGELAVNTGQYDKSNKIAGYSTILGKPLTDAFVLENQAEWSGCIVDSNCIEYYDDYIDDEENGVNSSFLEKIALLKKYHVPMKKGKLKEFHTVNWTTITSKRIDRKQIREAFGQHNKNVNNWNVEMKIRNTLDFYDALEADHNKYLKFMHKKK